MQSGDLTPTSPIPGPASQVQGCIPEGTCITSFKQSLNTFCHKGVTSLLVTRYPLVSRVWAQHCSSHFSLLNSAKVPASAWPNLRNPPTGFVPRQSSLGARPKPGDSPKICSLHVQSQDPPRCLAASSRPHLNHRLNGLLNRGQPQQDEPLSKRQRASAPSSHSLAFTLFVKFRLVAKQIQLLSSIKETSLGDNCGQTPGPDAFLAQECLGP